MNIDRIKYGKSLSGVILLNVLCLLIALALSGCSEQGVKADIANHLVVVVDASGSYKARQAEAVERAVAILEGMSKTSLRRWESCKISIISLDASPDTIWQGELKDLKAKSPAFWKDRFMARTDYASCTDVSGAFRLAARHLEGDSRYVSKYLFVFSDMLHEPPTSNMRTCQSPVRVSPEDFPWANLGDVSVSIFWMPPDQKLLWRKAVQERGLEALFALYTTSESATVSIPNPPQPKEKITEEDRKAQQGRIVSGVKSMGEWSLIVIGAFGFVIIAGFLFQRYRGRQSAPAFRVPVARMPVPPRPRPGIRPMPPAGRPIPGPSPSVIPQRRRPQ